jgi:hypothetical protein
MTWVKKGLIITPDKNLWWNKTHGMLPTATNIKDNLFKIFYSGRDTLGRSQIGYSVVEIIEGDIKFIETIEEPVLQPGERGCFDDNGVTPSCVIDDKLYYIGWNSGTTTYRMSLVMGLAIEQKNKLFSRHSRAPIMQRTDREPFGICTAPFILKSKKGFKMWYVSGESWINKDLPTYNIKYAYSTDGVNWKNEGQVALELEGKETALARPCVLCKENKYEMYFSYKDPVLGYRIGYAVSQDGIEFERSNDFSEYLGVSKNGWDSEMVEYSFVFDHQGRRYMLYNGNGYGENGIGYAVKK